MNTDNIEQTQTQIKKRIPSHWNLALQEFNKTRPQGSKYIMPKRDTEDYLKVKAISDRLKNDTSVAPSEPKVKKPRLKKIKEVKEEVTEKVKKPRAKKVKPEIQIDIPPSV